MVPWDFGGHGKGHLLALPLSFPHYSFASEKSFLFNQHLEGGGEGTFLPQTVAGENLWNRSLGSVEERAPHQEEERAMQATEHCSSLSRLGLSTPVTAL